MLWEKGLMMDMNRKKNRNVNQRTESKRKRVVNVNVNVTKRTNKEPKRTKRNEPNQRTKRKNADERSDHHRYQTDDSTRERNNQTNPVFQSVSCMQRRKNAAATHVTHAYARGKREAREGCWGEKRVRRSCPQSQPTNQTNRTKLQKLRSYVTIYVTCYYLLTRM